MTWQRKRFLIWGKTYPEFSRTYYETVCTGAIDEESGRLVRIYPITLRYMKDPFKTFDWIEADVERNTSDFRPESYRIRQDTVKVVGHLGYKPKEWVERSRWVLQDRNVFASVEALQAAEAEDHTSLGLVRPREIVDVYCKRLPASERTEWESHRRSALAQKDLFVDAESETKDLQFMPVRYRLKFRCDDTQCHTLHDFSILDWGVYVLSRKVFAMHGSDAAQRDVVARIKENLDRTKREPYLFLGNTKTHSRNFMIVGLFHPPKEIDRKKSKGHEQPSLFD